MKKKFFVVFENVLMFILLALPVGMVARGIYDVLNYSMSASIGLDAILLFDGILFLIPEVIVLVVYLLLRRKEKKQFGEVRKSIIARYFKSFKTKPYITIPVTLLVIVFVFYLVVFLIEDKLLFVTRPDGGGTAERYENVSIVTIEDKYKGYYINNNSDRLLVYFYGNAMLAGYVIEQFMEVQDKGLGDYDVMIFDYPGYGLNHELEQPSDKAIYKMIDSICEYMVTLGQYTKKYVTGFSLGTGSAVYAAAKGEWDALALIAPYDSITNVFNSIFPAFYGPFAKVVKNPFPSYKYAPLVEEEVLIYCSEADEMVPCQLAKKLSTYFKSSVELRVEQEPDHNELNRSSKTWDGILGFFEER